MRLQSSCEDLISSLIRLVLYVSHFVYSFHFCVSSGCSKSFCYSSFCFKLLCFFLMSCIYAAVLYIIGCAFVCICHTMVIFSCFLVARNSFVCPPGADGPRPMAIFELLDYIVNEVCSVRQERLCWLATDSEKPDEQFAKMHSGTVSNNSSFRSVKYSLNLVLIYFADKSYYLHD